MPANKTSQISAFLRGFIGNPIFLAKTGMLAVVLATIFPVWLQNRQLSTEIQNLHRDVEVLRQQVQISQIEIKALQNDPIYVEYLLRTQLHYGYKSEYILREDD